MPSIIYWNYKLLSVTNYTLLASASGQKVGGAVKAESVDQVNKEVQVTCSPVWPLQQLCPEVPVLKRASGQIHGRDRSTGLTEPHLWSINMPLHTGFVSSHPNHFYFILLILCFYFEQMTAWTEFFQILQVTLFFQ